MKDLLGIDFIKGKLLLCQINALRKCFSGICILGDLKWIDQMVYSYSKKCNEFKVCVEGTFGVISSEVMHEF